MSSTHLKCVCTFPVLPLPVCPVLRVALRAELQVQMALEATLPVLLLSLWQQAMRRAAIRTSGMAWLHQLYRAPWRDA